MVVNSLGSLSFPELLHNIGQPGSRCLLVIVIGVYVNVAQVRCQNI